MGQEKFIFSSKNLENAQEMIKHTPEVIEYFEERLAEKIKKHKLEKIFPNFRPGQFEKEIRMALDRGDNPWQGIGGNLNDSFADNLQRNKADEAAKKLTGELNGTIDLHVAINDDSNIVRGYVLDDKTIEDNDKLDKLDALLNGWFAENDIISKNGSLYKKGADGQIEKVEGKPVKADASEVRALFKDPEKGFEAYMDSKNFDLSVKERKFPKPPAAEAAKVTPAAGEKAETAEVTPTPEPEASSTTPGSGGGGAVGGGKS